MDRTVSGSSVLIIVNLGLGLGLGLADIAGNEDIQLSSVVNLCAGAGQQIVFTWSKCHNLNQGGKLYFSWVRSGKCTRGLSGD